METAGIQINKADAVQRQRVTQWVNDTAPGRPRGPVGLGRAFVEILFRPRRFFAETITPADQAPALVFFATIVGIEELLRLVLEPGAAPVIGGRPVASIALVVALTVVLIAPLGLHLLAAIQTVLLWPLVEDRGGVSETVQVLAYATAPAVFAGVPVAGVRILVATYGFALLVVGLSIVHDVEYQTVALAAALPGVLLFGIAFRGFEALGTITSIVF